MSWKGKYVRVAKIGVQEFSKAPTPLMQDYQLGYINPNVSIPLTYWLEGFLINEPEVGAPMFVDRRVRNGVRVIGALQTTQVTSVEEQGNGLVVKTYNSVYLVTPAEEKKEDGTHQTEPGPN